MDYSYEMKIPSSRVAVLIGTNGSTKKKVEQATSTRITVDSKEGDVFITGGNALGLYSAREIITAIGRGFNPDVAMLLLKQDYAFEQIDLAKKLSSKKHFTRIKGRVIGSEGKSRRIMEELTDCKISVYGKTIAIIGEISAVAVCRRAIENLISGARHSTVYRFLEKQRSELKRRQVLGEL